MAGFDYFDEELAALLALDALEPDEQADGELGSFGVELAGTGAALAELVVTEPPAQLWQATRDRAIGRRGPGRPTDAAVPSEPAEAFARTVADLAALLETLTEADWDAPAHPEHGRVRDVVAHLVGIERLSQRWLLPDDSLPLLPDHVAATRPLVDELADADPRAVAREWHRAALAVGAAAAVGDPERAVAFHDLQVSVPGLLVIRTFEIWAHAMDVASVTGRPLPRLDPQRMALLSGRLMAMLPNALAYRGNPVPGGSARFVLTGAAGGCYTVPLAPVDTVPLAPVDTVPEAPVDTVPLALADESGAVAATAEPDFTLVADPVDLCRIAARRLRPDRLAAAVMGDRDLAERVLADLDAFARD